MSTFLKRLPGKTFLKAVVSEGSLLKQAIWKSFSGNSLLERVFCLKGLFGKICSAARPAAPLTSPKQLFRFLLSHNSMCIRLRTAAGSDTSS